MTVMARIAAEAVNTTAWANWFASRERRRAAGRSIASVTVADEAIQSPQLRDGFLFVRDNFLGQPCVGERLGLILAGGEHPLQKLLHGVPLPRILNLFGGQQPRKRRDRIRRFSRFIRYRRPEVGGHCFRRSRGCNRDARQVCLDERAARVLHVSVGQMNLNGVDQLYITERVGRSRDLARNTIVALGAEADGPTDSGAFTDLLPFRIYV